MSALHAIDIALARRFASGDGAAAAAIALASWAVRMGHAGLPLDALVAGDFAAVLEGAGSAAPPDGEALAAALALHPAFGPPEAGRPFVIDRGLLYLRRVWTLEVEAAERLRALAHRQFAVDAPRATRALDQLLPDADGNGDARAALLHAASAGLTVLTGGPGTGKTWTAARLLAYLRVMAGGSMRMVAAAPTGKAAARLGIGLRAMGSETGDVPTPTLHRLLGIRTASAEPRHGLQRPLALDVLVLDEASMVDLPLLVRLLRALPQSARLVLLGDPDQLPALEGGRVLGDLLAAQAVAADASPLRRCVHRLGASRRFGSDSMLARALDAVRAGEVVAARMAIDSGDDALTADWSAFDAAAPVWRAHWLSGFAALREGDIGQRLDALQRFRILCAGREGRHGIEGLNAAVEQALLGRRQGDRPYEGRPILIRHNTPRLDLWNGDLGVIAPAASGGLRAWFAGTDGAPRSVPLDQLPEHDTAYAMTVHKAQGSEFDDVMLVLPPPDSPLLSREWLYTGLSRARARLQLAGDPAAFAAAINRPMQRWSRLAGRLAD